MSENPQPTYTLVGTMLDGGYCIVRLLGEGGMGAVYEAAKLPLNNPVAVKVMSRELAASTDSLKRFHREAEITSRLGHPHIVQVFDFGATPTGEPFLVMELLKGEDLHQRILRVGRLTPQQTLHIVRQIASALAATHAKEIVHRDLKPANIFILEVAGETDFVKVLDFGISKVRRDVTQLTKNAVLMGTPSFMSPEQASGQVDEIDGSTDQWALACIAWDALSGGCPFVGDDSNVVLYQVLNFEPPPLVARVPGLRPEVERVLRRALAKKKSNRFASVTEFAVALEHAVQGVPYQGHAAPPVAPTLRADEAVPPAAASRRGMPTTFGQTAGELSGSQGRPRLLAGLRWGLLVGVAAVLLSGALWLFRPHAASQPVLQPPAEAAAPPLPAPPPPLPPVVEEKTEPPVPPPKTEPPEPVVSHVRVESNPGLTKRKAVKPGATKAPTPLPPDTTPKPEATPKPAEPKKVERRLIKEL